MASQFQTLVIGGGVVGLATAKAILKRDPKHALCLVDASVKLGSGISSRSSQVIHAGIYYKPQSLKALLCVKGKHMLYDYAKDRNITVVKRGKLIVATNDSQIAKLKEIKSLAERNNVNDLVLLSQKEAQAMEPALRCTGALFSPSTGVIDVGELVSAMEAEVSSYPNAVISKSALVLSASWTTNNFIVSIRGLNNPTEAPFETSADNVINCGGLLAPDIARTITTGVNTHDSNIPGAAFFAKGNYFKLTRASPFTRLIYPVPEEHGLGIHLTVDVYGDARFGPDVEWITKPNYHVDPARADEFAKVIRSYFPELPDASALVPDYAGIRPKLGPSTEAARDFVIWTSKQHGVPGLVHCLGIESPGITSSLALGEHVAEIVLV